MKYYPNRWAVVGTGFIISLALCRAMASADETEESPSGYHPFEGPSSPVLNTGFLLSFVQLYYQTVDTSLQEKSYFDFRYYLASRFESFDKQQFISENPQQASDLAWRALHSTIRKSLENIEFVKIARAYINGLTNLKMVIGRDGAKLHGPSLTGLGLRDSAPQAGRNNKMVLGGGLTFADDFRLGLMFTMKYHRFQSKLRYYPTSRNEFVYTAEAQLAAATKIALSYRGSQDKGGAVMTTLSYQF